MIQITDHAILRYLERVQGVDIDVVKNMMLNDKTKEIINTIGTGKVPVKKTEFAPAYNLVVIEKKVITVEM